MRLLQKNMFQSSLSIDVCFHVTTVLNEGSLMLIGGCDFDCIPSNKVSMGNMSKDDLDVHWTGIYLMIIQRQEPVAFKLNNEIYVAAGLGPEDEELCSCEKYDEKKSMRINVIYSISPSS